MIFEQKEKYNKNISKVLKEHKIVVSKCDRALAENKKFWEEKFKEQEKEFSQKFNQQKERIKQLEKLLKEKESELEF